MRLNIAVYNMYFWQRLDTFVYLLHGQFLFFDKRNGNTLHYFNAIKVSVINLDLK